LLTVAQKDLKLVQVTQKIGNRCSALLRLHFATWWQFAWLLVCQRKLRWSLVQLWDGRRSFYPYNKQT